MFYQEPDSQQSDHQTDASERAEQRAAKVLKLLHSSPSEPIGDPELRAEVERLFDLMKRIDELAEQELHLAPAGPKPEEPADQHHAGDASPTSDREDQPGQEPIAFDPAELDAWEPAIEQDEGELVSNEGSAAPFVDPTQAPEVESPVVSQSKETKVSEDNLQRWWVSFNGDISLDRLSRTRTALSESPFTIEARFDDITDGLIVLRVVTERHLTFEQVEWLVQLVMQSVGLDRNAAVISRN
jgi:hypothetical protein